MTTFKLGAALAVGTLSLMPITAPASAASPSTRAFMDNVSPNIDFLDQSSRLALTTTKNARLKSFAHDEASEQTLAANTLYDWSNQVPDGVTKVAAGEPQLQTGRSVAIDTNVSGNAAVNVSAPLGQEELDALYGLDGKEFDDLYKQHQHDALAQVQNDYETYMATGDDPVLKNMAAQQLPQVKHRLEILGKL